MEHPVQEKLDIKILILFILRRLPGAVETETLLNLALADGASYFEYAECLGELEDSSHVERKGSMVSITEKGDRNCEIVETCLPYTLRSRLEKILTPMAESMRRRAMITTEHQESAAGWRVELSLSDEMGEIIELRLLCGTAERAEEIERKFRADAENYYTRIMNILLE